MAAGLHATIVMAMVMAETANFTATLLFIVPSLLSAALARGGNTLAERLQFGPRSEIFVERLGHELLGGPPVQRAGETQFEVPVRVEPQRERGLRLARQSPRPRQRHHLGLGRWVGRGLRRGRRRRRFGRLEALDERALLLDY